jgi:hypothetical protein
MVKFALPIPIRVVNAIVDDPELVKLRVNIHARHHPDAFDDGVGIAAVLPAYQLDLEGAVMISTVSSKAK